MSGTSWLWSDIGIGVVILALFGLVMLLAGIWLIINFIKIFFTEDFFTGRDVVSALGTAPCAILLIWSAYSMANERRLLRGECRYTADRVYHNRHIKGDEVSRFEYWVAGKRYDFQEQMEWRGGWKRLGSWWYVRFAVPDPGVYEYLDRPVPDSVCYAPGRGWARLPGPPRPPPLRPLRPARSRPPSPPRSAARLPPPARRPRPCSGRRSPIVRPGRFSAPRRPRRGPGQGCNSPSTAAEMLFVLPLLSLERLPPAQARTAARLPPALATLMNTPRWGQPAVGAGLRWGQAFGTPLFFGLIEEAGEGYFGDKADKWAKAQDDLHKAQATRRLSSPPHPDSQVFRDNTPTP